MPEEKKTAELKDKELKKVTGGIEVSKSSTIQKQVIYKNRQNTSLYAWVVNFIGEDKLLYYDVVMDSGSNFKRQGASKRTTFVDFASQYLTNFAITDFTVIP